MRYIRKIYYLDLYQNNLKIRNCGYLKMESFRHYTNFYFHMKNLFEVKERFCTAYITWKEGKITFEDLKVSNGLICETRSIDQSFLENQIIRIDILLSDQKRICCFKDKETENEVKSTEKKEENKQEPIEAATVTCVDLSVKSDDELGLENTKWEQLKKIFPTISVFGEETETLLIKPKDLVVLPEEYHNLASNSFLLHGYYNYRQLLLSKWNLEEEIYYIGVPGNFYEREKKVALMFGFEGFENGESSRRENVKDIYPGCFGYYMRRVSL